MKTANTANTAKNNSNAPRKQPPPALPLPHGTSELAAAYLLGQEINYDPHSGQPLGTADAKPARGALAERSVGARAGLEPPRFCPLCGRRMQVQVDPMGWTAACSRHGDIDATLYFDLSSSRTSGSGSSQPDATSDSPASPSPGADGGEFTPQPARRVAGVGETIFATMSALAAQHNAANLGQGFPDEDGPTQMLDIAAQMVHGPGATMNQYGPGRGLADLRAAIADDRAKRYGHNLDPESEIAVTVGATEALAASILGLVEPGDEVVALEPTYDAYPAAVGLAGGQLIPVRLERREGSFVLDRAAFAAALSPQTAVIILNTPHNPTGAVLSPQDLEFVADCVRGTGIVVITDEVYEHLVFAGRHVPFATLEGMRERTVSISSAAKSFNVTGWKIGWVMAPAELLGPIVAAKQYLSYVGATPFQPAVAWAVEHAHDWSEQWRDTLARRRTRLANALSEIGMQVYDAPGTYFLITDIGSVLPGESAEDFCMRLPRDAGVAAIPVTAFLSDVSSPHRDSSWDTLVRWTFCKDDATIDLAIERLQSFFRTSRTR